MAEEQATPTAGEETKRQAVSSMVGGSNAPRDKAPDPGTFEVYRKMRKNATTALARAAATVPVLTGEWSIEADDDADPEHKQFIQDQATALWPTFVADAVLALDYGFQAFEKVFEAADGSWIITKLKPLLPDLTEVQIDKATGAFAGFKNRDVLLPPEKCILFTYDGEAGNPYGRSRFENYRETAWAEWRTLQQKRQKYAKRVAGAVPQVEYPEGEAQDASGATRPNYELARALVERLENCDGVYMPNTLAAFAGDIARAGMDPDKLRAWKIGFLESSGQHGDELTKMMEHCEAQFARGWLTPERGLMESRQAGSRADSETHGEVSLGIADLLLLDLVKLFQKEVVVHLSRLNYGPEAANKVRLVRAGLNPELLAFFRELMKLVLGQPANVDLAMNMLDFNAMLDKTGLPKSREIITSQDQEAQAESVTGRQSPTAQPGQFAASMLRTVLASYRRAAPKDPANKDAQS